MRIFILVIIILTVLGILESKSIIPSTSFGVLSTLSMIAAFIKSLNIHSYYLIIPNITFTTSGILATLLILFIVGYVLERFRTLEQNNIDLVKRIQKLKEAINTSYTKIEDEDNKKDNEMKEIAEDIRAFLSKLAESVTVNPSVPVRSKKIRRVAAENVAIDSSNTIDQLEDVSITDEQSNSTPINEELNQDNQLSEDTESVNSSETEIDDNMSKIDLARALIESGEKDRAREIIMDIIKKGTSDEAHEAKILNLQIN